MDTALDAGLTARMLVSASLVLLMTRGLALFYGGMVRTTSVLNMMMMSFGSMAVVGAIVLGAASGGLCAGAVGLKYRLGLDDSLDVVGVHLVAGQWGTIATVSSRRGAGCCTAQGGGQLAVQVVIALVAVEIAARHIGALPGTTPLPAPAVDAELPA